MKVKGHEITTSVTPLPVTRCDPLPENARYRDTGCEYSSSCLACPLPACKYDMPPVHWEVLQIKAVEPEARAPVIADRLGISLSTAFRALRRKSPAA